MLRFFYNKQYKYTNRKIVDIDSDTEYRDIDYQNIDSPDTINGHIVYTLVAGEEVPTYIQDLESGKRWYVSGITQNRTGKFQISLIRDIISESPELWKNEEAYIEAGFATDYNKYKRWNLPYTNTKVREERLNVNGKSSFFVFYVNEQEVSNSGAISEKNLVVNQTTVPGYTNYDFRVDNLNEINGYEYVNSGTFAIVENDANISLYIYNTTAGGVYNYTYNLKNGTLKRAPGPARPDQLFNSGIRIYTNDIGIENNTNNCVNNLRMAMENFIESQHNLGSSITNSAVSNLANYVDKVIYNTTNQKFYTIKLNETSGRVETSFGSNATTLTSALRSINWPTSGGIGSRDIKNFTIRNNYFHDLTTYTQYTYTLQELGTATSFNFTLRADVPKLPKSAVRCVNIVSSGSILDSDLARMLMAAQTNGTLGIDSDGLSDTANVGRIIDIQFLPFSVAKEANDSIKINEVSQIAQFLEIDDFQYSTDLVDLNTINKETDTIKVVSPSRASQYLFRPYDNNGNMKFNTKITIKPYNSVIYVRPSTQGLLLTDWDDKDCLIIAEDFSLTNVTSQWTEYVYNNRNFQNAFERNIQGREFERTWERRIEDAQKKSDEWNARNISAQKAQTYTGNLPIISGIAGAIGTAWQDENYMRVAQLDREYNEALYKESVNIAREQFSYQLDNIKSQPQIPSKVTTIDCKFLDGIYLEYYSTNETELDAISNYYKYNGNRIDSYGTFADYYGWFVRGKIIISNNYTQPELDELNRRLGLGIFTEVDYA